MNNSEKLDRVLESLARLEKHHKIMPDRETTITNFEESLKPYEEFALQDLNLEQITINNHKSAILGFLNHSQGIINKETVKAYLDSNELQSWKTNQLKALRKYIRDYLKLGNWIVEEFKFLKARVKLKTTALPSNEQLVQFCSLLPSIQLQLVFLIMMNSGLRIGEVLSLKWSDLNLETRMIDASEIHKGETKFSWFSFFTDQTSVLLEKYLLSDESDYVDENSKLFSISARSVQQAFIKASVNLGISLKPHLLRTIFSERCREAGIEKEYIEAFCGRIPKGVLAQNYTNYSPEALRKQYDKVEPYLAFISYEKLESSFFHE